MFRRRLEAAAAPELLVDAICADSLLRAWESDRLTGKRELHNRRRARQFDIYGNELEGLAIRAEKRIAPFKARSGAPSFVPN